MEASFGYKHTEDTKQRMKDIYSEERKEQIGSINRGKFLSDVVKLRDRALNLRTLGQQAYAGKLPRVEPSGCPKASPVRSKVGDLVLGGTPCDTAASGEQAGP